MEDRLNPIPVVANGLVFIAYRDGLLHALDECTGQKKWEFWRGVPYVKAAAGEDCIYVAGRQSLFALKAHSGLVRWESDNMGGWPDASPTLAYDRIYVVAGNILYAFHSGTGQTVWQATVGAVNASVVAFRDKVYVVGHQQKGNTLFAFDASTGQLLWESEVEARQVEAWTDSTKVTSECLHLIDTNEKRCLLNPETGGISRITHNIGKVVNGVCYYTEPSGYDSILCADDLAANTRKWENTHYARCPIITVEHGLVFLYDRSPYGPFYDIITLNEVTGEYRWSQNKFYTYGTELILINGIGYAGIPHGIRAFDAMTGETKWGFEPDFIRQGNDKWSEFNAFAQKIALANGMLYTVANKAEELYALDEITGYKIWAYSPHASLAPI